MCAAKTHVSPSCAEPKTNPAGLGPWVIGGPARNGKTALVNALGSIDASVAGLPVEGLLGVYDRRSGDVAAVVREYLERPRWLDGARSRAARPLDFLDTPIAQVIVTATHGGGSPLSAIGRALDVFAAEKGRPAWAVADLHAELVFHRLARALPGLRLGVVLRDPRESLAAALYWRSYPERHQDAWRLLRYGLVLWCLSAETAFRLARLTPECVMIFRFNRLVDGDFAELQQVGGAFGVDPEVLHATLPQPPHYAFVGGNAFVTPLGSSAPLLKVGEIALIEDVAGRWMRELGLATTMASAASSPVANLSLRMIVEAIIALGRFAPVGAKALTDEIFSPGLFVRRFVSSAVRKLRTPGNVGA